MKLIIAAVVIVMGLGVASAEESAMLDFSSFFTKARAGISINQHMEKSTIIYSAVERLHTTAGVELANLNAGYDLTSKHPTMAIGVRADNIIPMIWSGPWGKAHITTASLPALEFGPYCSAWPRNNGGKFALDFWYGVTLAVGFAK